MDRALEEMVSRTGVAVPLAARIFQVVADSGASQIEISAALDLVSHLRRLLPVEQIADGVGVRGFLPRGEPPREPPADPLQ